MRRRRWSFRLSCLLLAIVWFSTPVMQAVADGATDIGAREVGLYSPDPIGAIRLQENVQLEWLSVLSWPNEYGVHQTTIQVKIVNQSERRFDFSDYWIRLREETAVHALQLAEYKDRFVAIGSERIFTFYTENSRSLTSGSLSLNVVHWKFEKDAFESQLGTIDLPPGYSFAGPDTEGQSIDGQGLIASVRSVTLDERSRTVLVYAVIRYTNEGDYPLILPLHQYRLRVSGKSYYPLMEQGKTVDHVVNPGKTKEVLLRAEVPGKSFDRNSLELLIVKSLSSSTQTELISPVASFQIRDTLAGTQGLRNRYETANEYGEYSLKIEQLQRLPWEDEDLYVITIDLANTGGDPAPLPILQANLLLDGQMERRAEVRLMDRLSGIQPGQSATYHIVSSVPFSYEPREVVLQITEKIGMDSVREWSRFLLPRASITMEMLNANEVHSIEYAGSKQQISVEGLYRFEGDSSDLALVKVRVQNRERRPTSPSRLKASFQTGDGSVLPAEAMTVSRKVFPDGEAVLWFWSRLPKAERSDNPVPLRLLIGETIMDSDEQHELGYANAASFELLERLEETPQKMAQINLYPYKLDVKKLKVSLSNYYTYEWKIEFDYELRKIYAETPYSGTVRFEFLTLKDEELFSWEFKLDDPDGLQLGRRTMTASLYNQEAFRRFTGQDYRLKVYDVFEGHKRLLFQKDWQFYSELS